MTDIMKLATDYAQACYNLANPDSYDAELAEEARAALQSAFRALQAECAEHKENAIRNARIAVSIRAERDQLQSKLGDAIQSSAHWQHRFTEAQAENERLKSEREALRDSAKEVARLRDQLQAKLDAMGKGEPDGNALLQAIARGWCSEKNSGKVMDALLALAIRDEVQKLYAAPKALAPEPDMFWNNADPERQHGSIEEFLNDEICQGQPVEVGAVYTIQQAKRLPNVQIKVTSIDEESCEAEYEVLSAHGIGGTP